MSSQAASPSTAPKKPKQRHPGGRPTLAPLDDPAVVEDLLDRIAAGRSILQVCEDVDMPAESTVYLRMARDAEFRSLIAQAREAQQEREADHTVDMADKATNEDWQVVKLRIWARQWRMGKLAPKKYSEKLIIDQTIHTDPEAAERKSQLLSLLLSLSSAERAGDDIPQEAADFLAQLRGEPRPKVIEGFQAGRASQRALTRA